MRISLSAPSLVLLLVGSHGASAAQMDVRDLIGGLFGTHPTTTSSSAASTATAATEKSAGLMSNLLNGLLGTGSSSSSEGVLGDLLDPISSVMSDVASNAQSINQAISTSAAKKRPKQRVPSCATYSSIGGPCGNSPRQCCSTGLTCSQNTCQLLCPASTTLPYCDTSSDCDATYGLVCVDNKCTKPDWANWSKTGESCDQGTGYTQYCLPFQAVCVSGTCQSCNVGA